MDLWEPKSCRTRYKLHNHPEYWQGCCWKRVHEPGGTWTDFWGRFLHKIPATTGLHSKDIFYSEWFKTASNFFFRGTSIFMLPPLENKAILINCFLAVQHVSVGAKIIHVFADTTFAPFSKKKLARLMIMSYFPFNFF